MNTLRPVTAVAIGPPCDFGVTGRRTFTAALEGGEGAPSASATTTGPRTAPAGTVTMTRCSEALRGFADTSSPAVFVPRKVTEDAPSRCSPLIAMPDPGRT